MRSSFPHLVLAACLITSLPLATPSQASDADNLDKLLAPIALYPDALLAQVLSASTSPEQVTEFRDWLGKQTATGSDLQQLAMNARFDAAFASLAIFPDVIKLLADNMDWTKELGTAYMSSRDKVSESIQRLRAKAQAAGNLKSNDQQKVSTEKEGGSQTIIIESANPEVVYVPQYDPTVVYVQSAPPQSSSSNDAAMGALVGFGIGIAIGAAMSNDYYGYGAWGYGWHGGGCHYHHSVWVVPAHPRYPYARPVPGYRPRPVAAPRYSNPNRNRVDPRNTAGNRVNGGNQVSTRDQNRGDAGRDKSRDRDGDRNAATTRPTTSDASRGRPTTSDNSRRSGSSAFGDYGNGSSTRASSDRGRSSVSSSRGGGGRSSGGGRSRGGGGRRR